MILRRIKDLLKKNPLIFYLVEKRKNLLYSHYAKVYDDETFIRMLYRKFNHGREPDLENPKRFTEKLQWLKLHYRNPDIPICSDKVEAKKYIAAHGFPELVVPTIAVYDSPDEIDIGKLPENFILKASHGSGWNIICRGEKASMDWGRIRKTMGVWLSENLYILGREWNYKEQTPRILAEELLDSKTLVDYKFMCFNGKCRAQQVNHEIGGRKYVDIYDSDWRLIPDFCTGVAPHSDLQLPKPDKFDEMKAIAEKLAAPFPFVRVDLYNVNGKIYFGEMTYFPGSGFWTVTPEERDFEFGSWLELPAANDGD